MSKGVLARREADGLATDADTTSKVVDSLVLRGDISALTAEERTRYYVSLCDALGLNPMTQPFAILRLQGKEILYPTRGATDQLAAIHKVNREIVDGPKLIDLAGTKLVYALCRATLPNGRVETSTATLPLSDPSQVLMKVETKSKRRATLAILGLAMLDESEIDSIPAHEKSPGTPITVSVAQAQPAPNGPEAPGACQAFRDAVLQFELPLTFAQAAAVWSEHRAALTEEVGLESMAGLWKELLGACPDAPKGRSKSAELKRACEALERKPTPPDGPKGGGAPRHASDAIDDALADAQPVDSAEGALRAHFAGKTNRHEAENSILKNRASWPQSDDEIVRIAVETLSPLFDSPTQCANAARQAVRNARKAA